MGFFIHLGDHASFKRLTAEARSDFALSLKEEIAFPDSIFRRVNADRAADDAFLEIYSGANGCLSSKSQGALFVALEEIFGSDILEYFFPGDMEQPVLIDGKEFVRKVEALWAAADMAVEVNSREGNGLPEMPWIELYTKVTVQFDHPHVSPLRPRADKSAGKVSDYLRGLDLESEHVTALPASVLPLGLGPRAQMMAVAGLCYAEWGPALEWERDESTMEKVSKRHWWALTTGLQELYNFGKLAEHMNQRGEKALAKVSV
jgi:hypothetical protein